MFDGLILNGLKNFVEIFWLLKKSFVVLSFDLNKDFEENLGKIL